MVHYISPYRTDKNLGKAINDAIHQLQADNEDWICHTDYDALWLMPDSKARMEAILEVTDYDILGPATNRLGSTTQLVLLWNGVELFGESDICVHMDVAKALKVMNADGICPVTDGVLSAFCLCFRVKVWKALGGFRENDLAFDWYFSEVAKKRGFKLGVCTGIYLFHLYRMDKSPGDFTHLLPVDSI